MVKPVNDRVRVRPMNPEDIEVVTEIEQQCFRTPWTREAFEKEIYENKLAVYLVAEMDGQVVGYIGMWHIVDEGHITNVGVTPQFRRLGIGAKLVQALLQKANELRIVGVTLEVRVSNDKARSLYEKYGFQSAGVRKKYYQDTGEDAIIMWRYGV